MNAATLGIAADFVKTGIARAGIPLTETLEAYLSLRRLNLAMWRKLTPEQIARPFTHPEYGELTVGWIMAQMAGHDLHHLKQLQAIE